MSAMELFNYYCQELVHLLPMNNETFITELRNHNLLSEDISRKMGSMTSAVERASYFLDNVIKSELHNNNVLNFNKLLKIMKESKLDNNIIQELSITIKSELSFYVLISK